jgi:Nidogen-like/Carboxypeptidase regulatory-like domain
MKDRSLAMSVAKLGLLVASALVVVAVLLAVSATTARAEGPDAIQDLPGCTSNTLPANDDGSTDLVPIGFGADFFGEQFTDLYVNNNGNVTFDGPLGTFTPFDFTVTGDKIIAPFLADVDTRGTGSGEVTYGQVDVGGSPGFCVNWIDVGYYNGGVDKLNSFQLLLIDRSSTGAGNFDIVFNYDKVQWETGSASGGSGGLGGTSAAVGFANGDGESTHSHIQPGSYTNGALLDGGPSATSLIANSRGTTQLGRYVFEVRNEPRTGATLTGTVTDEFGNPVGGAPVEICPTGGGPCRARITNFQGEYRAINLPAGSYELTAHDPNGLHADGLAGPVAVSGISTFTQDIVLGDPLQPPPGGTTITSIGQTGNGFPVVYWSDTLTLSTQGCEGGSASYEVVVDGTVVSNGTMTEGPAGTYTAQIAPLQPSTGAGLIRISIDCPSTPDEEIEFGIYINPSGFVREIEAEGGEPIPGATVTLFRSDVETGPFTQVPEGNVIMSPGNQRNPDLTDATGRFGWDVIAGYYKVRAEAEGCTSAETPVMTIPPPETDLDIRLDCGQQEVICASNLDGDPNIPGRQCPDGFEYGRDNPNYAFSNGNVKLKLKAGTEAFFTSSAEAVNVDCNRSVANGRIADSGAGDGVPNGFLFDIDWQERTDGVNSELCPTFGGTANLEPIETNAGPGIWDLRATWLADGVPPTVNGTLTMPDVKFSLDLAEAGLTCIVQGDLDGDGALDEGDRGLVLDLFNPGNIDVEEALVESAPQSDNCPDTVYFSADYVIKGNTDNDGNPRFNDNLFIRQDDA